MNDLLKNKLERRTENFWNLMAKNAEIKTLTPEQHEALANLANLRHTLHSNQETLFNDEADNTATWQAYDNINETLNACGLDSIDLPASEDRTTNIKYDIDNEGLNLEEWTEKYYPVFVEEMDTINKSIESYLEAIDKEHGTKYAPTGKTRLY